MKVKKTLADAVRTRNLFLFLRLNSGLSLLQVANACGLSTMQVCDFENRKRGTMGYALLALATFFNVPCQALLDNDFTVLPDHHLSQSARNALQDSICPLSETTTQNAEAKGMEVL